MTGVTRSSIAHLSLFREGWFSLSSPIAGIFLAVLAWFFCFYPALLSAANIWWVSEYYTHGFVVLPAICFCVWRRRFELAAMEWTPTYKAYPLLLLLLAVYLFAKLSFVTVFEHFVAFAMIPLFVYLCFGRAFFSAMLNILLLSFLAVPVGAELSPFLQQLSAVMAAKLLELTNIPFLRNGLFFQLPNGNFLVAEECSGVRFLIASVAFGVFYCEIAYRRWSKKFAFMLFAIVVPIVANIFRVYGIMVLGYYSDMTVAAGADHLIYGWVFFSIILLLMLLVGRVFEDSVLPATQIKAIVERKDNAVARASHVFSLTLFSLGLFIFFGIAQSGAKSFSSSELNLKSFESSYDGTGESKRDWRPMYVGADKVWSYDEDGLSFHIFWYGQDREGSEMVSGLNQSFDPEVWSINADYSRPVEVDSSNFEGRILELATTTGTTQLVLTWYQVGDQQFYQAYRAKFAQAIDRLSGGSGAGAAIFLSVSGAASEESFGRLQSQAARLLPDLQVLMNPEP